MTQKTKDNHLKRILPNSKALKEYLEQKGFHDTFLQYRSPGQDWGLVKDEGLHQTHVRSRFRGTKIEAEREISRFIPNHQGAFFGKNEAPLDLKNIIESFGYTCDVVNLGSKGSKLVCGIKTSPLRRNRES
jgi:hypothetical protein